MNRFPQRFWYSPCVVIEPRHWEKLTRPRRGTATPIQHQAPATERIGMRPADHGTDGTWMNLDEPGFSYFFMVEDTKKTGRIPED